MICKRAESQTLPAEVAVEILAEDNIDERLGLIRQELNRTFGSSWDDTRATRRRLLGGKRRGEVPPAICRSQ